MNCARFLEWLDAGAPPTEASRAHARECAACARELAAQRAVEAALATPAAAPPALAADFTERVIARTVLHDALAPARAPLWLRIARDPAVLSSAAALALAVAYREPIAAAMLATAGRLPQWIPGSRTSALLQHLSANAPVEWALGLTALAVVLAASWGVVQWAQGWNPTPLLRR